jgi:tetratricopeptide (TPR) repeat protein
MAEMSEEFEELTEEEINQLNEILSSKKDETVEFSEFNDMLSQMGQIYETGNYPKLLEQIENAIGSSEAALKKLQETGLSLALLSSQRWMDSIKDIQMGDKEAEELLLQAKRYFLDERYEDAAIAIIKLKDIGFELQNEQKEKLSELIKDVESRLEKAKDIGTNVEQAERMIKEAKATLDNDLLIKCSETLGKIEVLIGEAGEERLTVIKEAISFVESIIEDAKSIGADVESPLKHLEKAKAFFDNKDYQMCMHTTIQAEEMTTELIQKQVDRALALKKSLEDRYKAVATVTPPEEVKFEEMSSQEKTNCPTCGNPAEYIEQYNRCYCYNCQKYM